MGYIVLEGGAEFGGEMRGPDLRAIELAGGFDAPIRILPTAAAPDHNDARAGSRGRDWFRSLGATDVEVVPLTDRESASRPEVVDALRGAKLIYMLGGFPAYLAEALRDTPAWQAALDAWKKGAVIAGSSAGAMVLCEKLYDPKTKQAIPGLGLLPGACLLPHHNTVAQFWAADIAEQNPGLLLIGVDEQTGLINDGPNGSWKVYGRGRVSLYRDECRRTFASGKRLSFDMVAEGDPQRQAFEDEIIRRYRRIARLPDFLFAFTFKLRRRCLDYLQLKPGARVLEVGCSTGANFHDLVDAAGKDGEIVGVDLSPEMIDQAWARIDRAGWRNVRVIEDSAEEVQLEGQFDAILLFAMHDVLTSQKGLENVLSYLKPGGIVLAAGPRLAQAYPWKLLNPLIRMVYRRFAISQEDREQPWRRLAGLVSEVHVEDAGSGIMYLVWGRK
jgi:cyanophycinase-like exopeptidase/ubiquinone/menaquinone biosynthesis C-methylase UbiE